jgi:hypothetical protein
MIIARPTGTGNALNIMQTNRNDGKQWAQIRQSTIWEFSAGLAADEEAD